MAERIWADQQSFGWGIQLHVSTEDLFHCVAVGFSQRIVQPHCRVKPIEL